MLLPQLFFSFSANSAPSAVNPLPLHWNFTAERAEGAEKRRKEY